MHGDLALHRRGIFRSVAESDRLQGVSVTGNAGGSGEIDHQLAGRIGRNRIANTADISGAAGGHDCTIDAYLVTCLLIGMDCLCGFVAGIVKIGAQDAAMKKQRRAVFCIGRHGIAGIEGRIVEIKIQRWRIVFGNNMDCCCCQI